MVKRGVLITGGMGAIGLAVARAFAAEGADLMLLDLREDDGGAAAMLQCGGAAQVLCHRADVADEIALRAAVDLALDRFGTIDVIVNVAGMMIYKPMTDLTAADWRRLLDVNLVGAALLTAHGLRVMQPGGSIINIASIHARRTSPLVAPYAAAKAGMVSLTRSAAIEGKPIGIRVNAILPGAIDTPMLRASPTIAAGAESVDPADLGQPDMIAAVVTFLASDAARFITGEDIVVDGGRTGRL